MEESTKKDKAIFIIRAIAWFLLAGVLPFIFISWKFDGLFTTEPQLRLTGIGMVGLIILVITVMRFAKYVYKGMSPSIAKQCIHGAITIVAPLLILYAILHGIANNIETLKQAVVCVTICETVAIPVDPFPVWLAKKYQGRFENLIDFGINRFIKRVNDNKQE